MIGFFLGIGIIINFFICAMLLERNILKNIILSFFLYFCYYVTIGGILFALDFFSIEKTVALILITEGIALFCIMRNAKKKIEVEWSVREYLFAMILVLCILPFLWNKFGFYGMGQDEGVYQTQAIAFMNNSYKNQKNFLEYERLNESEKEKFQQFIDTHLLGFYRYNEKFPSQPEGEKLSDVSGFYHGIPTFSAILALWGKIFGMKHMAGIQTIFYICSIFLLFFICENLHFKKVTKYAVGILYVCSPIVIWVSKSSLTEMFLACIVIGFLYFLTSNRSNIEIVFAALSIVTFSMYHLTIYTMLPIFALLFWGMFLYSHNKKYIYAVITIFFSFMVSMIICLHIAATYTYGNFMPLYQMTGFIKMENLHSVLIVCSVFGILLSILILVFGKKVMKFVPKAEWIWKICVRLGIVLFVAIQAHIIYGFMGDECSTVLEAFQKSSIMGFLIYGGGILLILTFAYIFCKPSVCWQNAYTMIIMGMFVYCVMFYTSFMRKEIPFHYYYGRYLAPFIGIVVLMIGIVINEWKVTYGKAAVLILTLGYAAVCMPYNLVLAGNNDDTRMSWDMMEEIAGIIPENAVIYMNYDVSPMLYLPMRELTDNLIFPIVGEELEEKIRSMDSGELDIYYISSKYSFSGDVIYRNWYEVSENKGIYKGLVIPLPYEMTKLNTSVSVHKVNRKYDYLLSDDEIMLDGYYLLEGSYRWCVPKENFMRCVLGKRNYTVRVVQGPSLPMEALGKEEFEVKLKINGRYVDSYIITKDNLTSDLIFEVSEKFILEGVNDVSFICESWSPREYGANDSRILGIGIKEVIFE